MEDAVENWEDLLNDEAAFDKIVQLKDDGFDDEDIEPDQLEIQQQYTSTGPAQPSEKKLEQKERKRRMQEKLETTKKKYEENAFGNIMLPQDKRNLKLQQILLSKKQDEMNIASLIGEEEKLEIPIFELSLTTKENIIKFNEAISEKLKSISIELQHDMLIRGIEECLKQLSWSSKETGKMFEKAKTFLAIKEKRERSNKKDKKKQVHVNFSKAASKKLAVDDEESDEEENEIYEEVEDTEQKEEEKKENIMEFQETIEKIPMQNTSQVLGFIVRIIQVMQLIGDDKTRKEFSLDILLKITEISCEATPTKDWKSSLLDRVKNIHNGKMNEEKGILSKNKNPLLVSVNAGKATENEVINAVKEEEEQQQDEFDPEEDFM